MSRGEGGKGFFLAGRRIGSWQNGWALAGDYLSAAAFLGSIAMYFGQGIDSLYYAVATLIGWPLLLILFADRLQESGAYTLSGVLQQRFTSRRLQLLSSLTSLLVSLFYLLVQLMGAGTLLKILFQIPYWLALSGVSLLTLIIVSLGGMRATTMIQAIKAMILFLFAGIMLFLVIRAFNYSLPTLWEQAKIVGGYQGFMPTIAINNPLEQLSLILGLTLGLLGLPHVLMRFFTVKNRKVAIHSAAIATLLIALFFISNLIVGFGAYALFFGQDLEGGANMALLYLSGFLGGQYFAIILSIVVLITILAVMAGLVMAASANISQDLLPLVAPKYRDNMLLARGSILLLLLVSASLAYLFQGVNLAFLFGIAFAWAAAAHFPLLFCQFFMPSFNERGAFYGLLAGALLSTLFVLSSGIIWVNILGFSASLHPFNSPTLFVMPITFLVIWICRSRSQYESKKCDDPFAKDS